MFAGQGLATAARPHRPAPESIPHEVHAPTHSHHAPQDGPTHTGAPSPAAGKHRTPIEESLFRLVQQIVAPIDQRAQCLLAPQRRSALSRQEAKSLVKPAVDLLHWQRAHASRCKLNGKRDSVEMVADGGQGQTVLLGNREPRLVELRPLDEQHDGFVVSQEFGLVFLFRIREGE